MARELTAKEVLETAENLEREAARFYRKAAGVCDDPKLCKLLIDLAQWEKRHVQVFAQMREHLAQGDRGRHDVTVAPKPPAIFADAADFTAGLTGNETKADVLQMAIAKEKDTIAYYTRMKEFVPGDRDVETIKEILREEDRHVRILTQSLEQLTR